MSKSKDSEAQRIEALKQIEAGRGWRIWLATMVWRI